ncbi:hypothetical protein B0H14DRAFT_2612563 [Mycena olivaceomarginata]|nr:hypothetical protein B0H14DRAFT_2612563 [Mycena olivaceomarginata]
MLNALWQFIFPPKRQPEPPPLQRPRKYPRTGDARSSGQYGDAQENERFRGSDFAPGLQMQPHPAPLQSERPAFPAGSNLRRPNQDDVQIYFLARNFTRQELQNITADDPFAEAKRGKVTRHLTVPEAVLQAPEDSSGDQPIPLHFCKTDILVRKTAAARIPAGFWLATAYRCQGQEYSWELTDPISRKEMETPSVAFLPHERGSSPLSDAPSSQMDLGPLVQGEESLSHSKKGLGGLKRRREFDLEEEDRPGSRSSTTVDVGLAVPPCSTDYKWFPLLTWA